MSAAYIRIEETRNAQRFLSTTSSGLPSHGCDIGPDQKTEEYLEVKGTKAIFRLKRKT